MSALLVRSIGPGASLQDAGRFGWQRFGVGPAGAMDRWSLGLANMLAGNEPGAAVIEIILAGARLEVAECVARVALAGAECTLKVDGREVERLTSVTIPAGGMIHIGAARSGVFAYLAIAGGVAVAPALGSLSLHARTQVGGFGGRPLQSGDRLPLVQASVTGPDLTVPSPSKATDGPMRVVLGPQDDYFTPAGIETFLSSEYAITPHADRMGYRLAGPSIQHGDKGYNIVSDGIPTGGIQVPGAGEPIILLADRQTTGGYPKIATLISADLPRLVQLRPGAKLRFKAVSRQQAVAAARERLTAFESLRASLRPAGSVNLDSSRLLGLNLVDGWVSARE